MLTSLRLQSFRSVADQRVDLAPLTVLIGRDASRKGDIFDALHLLRGLASGLRAEEVLQEGQAAGPRTSPLSIETTWEVQGERLSYRVRLDTGPRAAILDEEICVPGQDMLRFTREDRDPALAGLSVLGDGQPGSSPAIDVLRRSIRSIRPVDRRPEGVAAMAREVCRDEARKAELLRWLSSWCFSRITDVDVSEKRNGGLSLSLLTWGGPQRGGGRVLEQRLLPTVRNSLSAAVAVLGAPEGSIVLVDDQDDDDNLPPFLESVARAGAVQIFVMTNSPWWLHFLGDEEFGNAVAVGRDFETSTTVMRRLRDLPQFDEIKHRLGVEYDYLFTTEWLRTR